MHLPDVAAWPWWVWLLHGVGVLYLLGFLVASVRFEVLERRAMQGGTEELEVFNQAVRGFPGAFYAKMLGKRPLEDPAEGAAPAAGA